MIGYLSGQLMQKRPPFLVLNVGGVGYELEAPMTTFYELPEAGAAQSVSLFVHMVVRDDAQLLFGFSDKAQRELFRSLLKISGIGPRVALAILSTLEVAQFINCIHNNDAAMLSRVPGIGPKTAERMIFNLRDRVTEMESARDKHTATESGTAMHDALSALIALGYKRPDAIRALREVENISPAREQLIRNALQYLSHSPSRPAAKKI